MKSIRFFVLLAALTSPLRGDDSLDRKGFGMKSFQPGENGVRFLDCRYYVAIAGSNLPTLSAAIRAYTRKPDAHIVNDSFQAQAKSRAHANFTYSKHEWDLTNGTVLSSTGSGFTSPIFPSDNQFIADITDAIQLQTSDGASPRLLLNLSVSAAGSKGGKPLLDHTWGVKTIDLTSVPFEKPADFNQRGPSFPFYIPADQTLTKATGIEVNQVLPKLENREQGSSHGLHFGSEYTYVGLNLYRSCK